MRVLELFSGTGSFSKAIKKKYNNTHIVSLDIHPKYNPTHCTDILTWNFSQYPPRYFDIIWSSPPCTEYSRAKTRSPRNLKLADNIVKKTLEIIKYFSPVYFFIENPSGMLRHRTFMRPYNRYLNTCSYCMYGTLYKKPTDIWSNISLNLKCCKGNTVCNVKKKYGKHLYTAQVSGPLVNPTQIGTSNEKTYVIPNKLLSTILNKII
jgi:site-specific DNA-cytosine methylase